MKSLRKCFAAPLTFTALLALSAAAFAEWPQYRGPNGDGVSSEKILAPWPSDGPKVLWKIPVGNGLGSFAIKDKHAYFMAATDEGESCLAVDVADGKTLWTAKVGNTQNRPNGQGGNGPGTTPVADGDKVYVYGSKLQLMCLGAADGKTVWEHDVQKEYSGQASSAQAISSWGNASSPIVEGDLVIIQGGGKGQSFMAFDKTTGTVSWKKDSETLTQSTPVVTSIAGVRQIIFLVQTGLISLDPKTGATLWKQTYPGATAIAASPVVSGDIVYCSIGYGVGGGAFQITKEGNTFSSKQLWRTPKDNANHWSTPVIKDGYVYGINGNGGDNKSPLQCIELATGKPTWDKGPAVGGGEVMLIDGKLLIQAASGKLMLAETNPKAYTEISTAQPIKGRAWGWPAYSDGVLIYRTDKEVAAVDLSAK